MAMQVCGGIAPDFFGTQQASSMRQQHCVPCVTSNAWPCCRPVLGVLLVLQYCTHAHSRTWLLLLLLLLLPPLLLTDGCCSCCCCCSNCRQGHCPRSGGHTMQGSWGGQVRYWSCPMVAPMMYLCHTLLALVSTWQCTPAYQTWQCCNFSALHSLTLH
jgi:hypothetical protein